jgi:hypothetical protein
MIPLSVTLSFEAIRTTMLQYTKPRLDPRQNNQARSFRVFDLGLVIML